MLGWLTVLLQYFFFLIKFLQPQAITTLHQLLVKLLNDMFNFRISHLLVR